MSFLFKLLLPEGKKLSCSSLSPFFPSSQWPWCWDIQLMDCTGAVLIADCRGILKSLNNANPLRSEKATMLTLKNLVTQRWESLFKTSNQQTTNKKKPQPNQQQQRSQNLDFSFKQRDLLLDHLAKQKVHLCWIKPVRMMKQWKACPTREDWKSLDCLAWGKW